MNDPKLCQNSSDSHGIFHWYKNGLLRGYGAVSPPCTEQRETAAADNLDFGVGEDHVPGNVANKRTSSSSFPGFRLQRHSPHSGKQVRFTDQDKDVSVLQ